MTTVLAEHYWHAPQIVDLAGSTSDNGTEDHTNRGFKEDFALRTAVIISSLPLQLCEHSVVSFAEALQKSGVSTGLALTFLLCAPATNIATIATVLRSSGNRLGAVFRSVIALSVTGLVLSYAADGELFHGVLTLNNTQVHAALLPVWLKEPAQYVCVGLLAVSMFRKRQQIVTCVVLTSIVWYTYTKIFGDVPHP